MLIVHLYIFLGEMSLNILLICLKNIYIYFIIFGCAGSLLLHGLYFSFGVQASHVGSTWTRNQAHVFCTGRFFTTEPPGKPKFFAQF